MFRTLNRWWQRRKGNATKAIATSEQGIAVMQQPNEPAPSEWVAYDEKLLERARTQWQFGDWKSLAALSREILQHHPDRAKLALLAAAGHQQLGDMIVARQFTRLAQDWGASKKLISQVLIAGVHNTLGRASTFRGDKPRALKHFEYSVSTANPNGDVRLLIRARTTEELERANSRLKGSERNQHLPEKKFFSSADYWEKRYQDGGNSGYGSYGRLAEFKAEVINKFIFENRIKKAIEFGCGDGNQLSKLEIEKYIGIDVSKAVIKKCRNNYQGNKKKLFFSLDDFLKTPCKAELTLSLDVIFHLTEDSVFESYMNTLLKSSKKYCIIYSCDLDQDPLDSTHVRKRRFTRWIKENYSEWNLIQIIFNKYPCSGEKNPKNHSFSNFYIYEKALTTKK